MAIKIKAKQMKMSVGPKAGQNLFVMIAEKYSTLDEEKVFQEAAVHSGMPKGSIRAAWHACGDVIKLWLTEGHSIPVAGLGTMRFGVTAKAVATVEEVKTELIRSRKILFTPAVDLKQALKETEISITCYDKDGNIVTENDAAA